ncbi:MAG: hypothetical protein JST59_01710 [Actinobacteria bacterium]|nr:hypothetical protein [Actinomycetota bacterium]
MRKVFNLIASDFAFSIVGVQLKDFSLGSEQALILSSDAHINNSFQINLEWLVDDVVANHAPDVNATFACPCSTSCQACTDLFDCPSKQQLYLLKLRDVFAC